MEQNVKKNVGTILQVDRIKNVATHRIFVQEWTHEDRPRAHAALWGGHCKLPDRVNLLIMFTEAHIRRNQRVCKYFLEI